MISTTSEPMTIPAIAPVDSLGLFLVVLLESLSGILGIDDGVLIIDNDGVLGRSETVDGDGDNVEIGSRVEVVGDSPLVVEVVGATTVMLIVGGGDGAGINVVTGEGTSGVPVAIGVLPGP